MSKFNIEFSAKAEVKAEDLYNAYETFYEWLDKIKDSKKVKLKVVIVDDDQIRPKEDLNCD